MRKEEFIQLAEKVVSGLATERELQNYVTLLDHLAVVPGGWDESVLGNREELETRIREAIDRKIKTKKVVKLQWKRWVAAASVIITLGIGSYVVFHKKPSATTSIAKTTDVKAPEKTKAILTLHDGSSISLDSLTSLRQENVNVTKTADGRIVYSREDGKSGSPKEVYNTLTNPKGSKVIDMTLGDGSHVWLNAGSSITYPVVFVGNERKVSMTGEGYFEAAHNTAKPFKVRKNDMEVTVLGTRFNVKAYDDDPDIKVTLLEGSVKVSRESGIVSRESAIIKPGQQAISSANGEWKVVSGVDLNAVMAWKNGMFQFGYGSKLEEVMNEIARWYDVKVVYENKPRMNFEGGMQRTSSLSSVMKILETSGVKFEIKNNTVTIR